MVDLPADPGNRQQGFELGGEHDPVLFKGVVKRLLADAVSTSMMDSRRWRMKKTEIKKTKRKKYLTG